MKRIYAVLVLLALFLSLAGCSEAALVRQETTATVRPISILNATVSSVHDGLVLLAGTAEDAGAGDLYTAETDLEIIALDGSVAEPSSLRAGMSVSVEYEGSISGNTPGRKIPATRMTVINEGNDLIGFYFELLKEYFEENSGLNSDIDTIAFDFSKLSNLRESEKSALMYLMGAYTKLPYISGTYEELGEQGIIDTKNLYFENGVLMELSTAEEHAENFTFSISKWRSGTGAIGCSGCKAKLKNGVWSYTPGDSWIS